MTYSIPCATGNDAWSIGRELVGNHIIIVFEQEMTRHFVPSVDSMRVELSLLGEGECVCRHGYMNAQLQI